jgi:colanic acid/amylovoran biosynthesis glycosyltransferase
MRIAYITHQFPVISETFVLHQVQGALAHGHEVDIYAPAKNGKEPQHAIYRDWKMDQMVRRRPATGFGSVKKTVNAIRISIGPAMRQPGLFARCVMESAQLGFANPLSLFGTAASVREGGRYDVVHAHFADMGLLALRLRRLGVMTGPILTSFHGIDVTRRRSPGNLAALRQLFAEGEAFTHPSDYLGECARAMGCPAVRQRKHYYGVDKSMFLFRARTLAAGAPVRVVSIGRLVEKKGLEYAIEAVARLVRSGRNIQYDIIGAGPLQDALAAQIERLGIEPNVHLLGAQDAQSVSKRLEESHVFMLPSVTAANGDMEGLPVSILEAQMCGLPVLATYHSGIPEEVLDGKSAFLVKERDTDALTARLGELVDHPELWPAMGRAGREFVEERFDIETLNDDLNDLYETLRAPSEKPAMATA